MYNFIVKLFSEDDYNELLDADNSKSKNIKTLIVPSNPNDPLFTIKNLDMDEELNTHPELKKYNKHKYFSFKNFNNPTNSLNNHIGTSSALLSHSLTHYKINNSFILKKDKITQQYSNGNIVIDINDKKIEAFKNSVKKTLYHEDFADFCDKVEDFFKNFNKYNPENKFGLKENDCIIFLIDEDNIEKYKKIVDNYTKEKILKYETFTGICDSCGISDQLYVINQGNLFDLSKGRKFILRHPTRYKTNLTSKSPENFNICSKCSKQIYNFFEYIKMYKFYRYVFPTTISPNKGDYKDYSSSALGILKMLRNIYTKNNSKPFDYIMMLSDPKLENIEFKYINNFDYNIQSDKKLVNIENIPLFSTVRDLPSRDKEDEITQISKIRNKSIFLRELNVLFNNTLIGSLFETNPKNLISTLHPFLKLKLIQYNSIIKSFIYFQDISLFEDKIYTRIYREMIEQFVKNPNLRVSNNKLRFFLTIYYKYVELEQNGGEIISQYLKLKEKMDQDDVLNIENEFEASYCMGQIFYYLLRVSKGKNMLELFTKYTMNVHDMHLLKKNLIAVLEKYSHNEYIDNNKKFHNVMKSVLAFEFKKSYEDNKIALYTGYFDNNYLYMSTKQKEEIESLEE